MKKRILSIVLTLAMVVASLVYQPAIKEVKAAAWNLVWSDEFDGNSLDTSIWTRETGGSDGGGWGNNELEYYTDRTDNSYVSDGTLKIVAKRENYGGCRFTSARLKSAGKKNFKYGRMEARIKVNGGNQDGVWPAFWMMGDDGTSWPWCGELDIMEHANSRNYVEGTIHWNAGGSSYGTALNHVYWGSYSVPAYYYYSDNTNNGINGWHTYGVVWTDSTIQWYVDNNVYLTAYLTQDNAYAFQKNHYFLLNLALGSNSTGYTGNVAPNDSFQSATMEVDYVRVFSGSGDLNDTNIGGTVTEPTTPSDGYTALVNNTVTTIGDCSLYAGSWDNGAISYKGSKLSDLNVRLDSTSGNSGTWGTQLKYPMNLIQGKKYNVTLKFDSTKTGTMYWKNEGSSDTVDLGTAQYAVNAGTNTKTIQITADSKNTAVMEMSGMPSGTVLNNISISAIQEADETTAKPAYQPQPGNFDAFNTIEAENYTSNNGGVIDENSSAGNGHNIGGILDKTSLTYGTVNFTEPASKINLQYSCPQDCGGTADVYCDGAKVGTVTLNSNASSWNEYGNVTAKLDSAITTGVHSIKLVFNTKSGSTYVCNLDYFNFTKSGEDKYEPLGYTSATANQWETSGKWGCYFGNWNGTASGLYKWVSDSDYNIYVDQANAGTEWLVQGSYTDDVTSGHTYKVSVDVTANKNCSVGIKEDISNEKDTQVYTDLTANSVKTITGTYKVTDSKIKIMFELGKNVNAGTNINFKNIRIEDITQPTTVASTTKAAPTTVAPTTKVIPTTVTPTTKVTPTTVTSTTKTEPATVAATTTATPATVVTTNFGLTDNGVTKENSANKENLNGEDNNINEINNKISNLNADKGDLAGASFEKIRLKAKAGKKKVSLSWKKVTGATEYIIYGSSCGKNKKLVKIKMVKGKKTNIKKLKKGKFYKYMIVAVNGNKVVAVSKVCHIATKGGKYGNVNKITLNKKKITLTKGKKFKIKAKAKSDKKVRNHIAKFRYESMDTNVAEVSSKGVVKAIGKGKTVIYVFGQNGISQKINVVVK